MKTLASYLSAILLFAAGCAPLATRWDYDPDAEFSHYKTFDWMPKPETEDDAKPAWDNPFLDKRVKQAAIVALEKKGFAKADDAPDLLVAFYLDIRRKTNVHVYGYQPWGPYPAETQSFREGTLIIDLVDAKTRQLVWRGWSVGDFDAAIDPGTAQAYIGEVVKKILKNYPPY